MQWDTMITVPSIAHLKIILDIRLPNIRHNIRKGIGLLHEKDYHMDR